MFISSLRNPSSKLPRYEEFIPDLNSESEKNLCEYIKTQKVINFTRTKFFGLGEVPDSGFSCSKQIKIYQKKFLANTIFELNEKDNRIKEIYSHDFVKINKETVLDNIDKMRENVIPNDSVVEIKNKI